MKFEIDTICNALATIAKRLKGNGVFQMVMLNSYHDTKMVDCCSDAAFGASLGKTASSADLGDSSKYSMGQMADCQPF